MDSLDASNSVGTDLGILNYIHTSDGETVDWLDLEDEYERLRNEQRKLSRKERGSNNWEKQRRKVAKAKHRIRRRVLDFQHKLTTWLVKEILRPIADTAVLQTVLQTALAFGIAWILGFTFVETVIVALATVFGATSITVDTPRRSSTHRRDRSESPARESPRVDRRIRTNGIRRPRDAEI